jgi:hypothetical protein
MLPLRLVRIAMEAEALRLRHQAKRTVTRAMMGCVAMALVLGALAFGHVAAWYWLREYMAGQYVALIFAGTDLLLALILAHLAARSAPGLVEREALAVRRRALDDAADSLTVSALLIRLLDQLILTRPRQ